MTPLISIIIPIYNVAPFLEECLDSVLLQTMTDFELILINDGSTDNSGEICESYRQKDKRISVIHKRNGGVSSARNKGIEIAQGEFIGFIDPDDTISNEMYDELYKAAILHKADMVICPIKTINLKHNTKSISTVWKSVNCIINRDTIEKDLIPSLLQNRNYSLVSCVNKLYKRTLFDSFHLRFDENKSHSEDIRLNFELLTVIESMVYITKPLYNYYQRERESLSRVFRVDLYCYVLDNKRFFINISKQYNLEKMIGIIKHHYSTVTLSYLIQVANSNLKRKEKAEIISEVLMDNEFSKDIKDYNAPTNYYRLLRVLCVYNNTLLIYGFIRLKTLFQKYLLMGDIYSKRKIGNRLN